MITGPGGEAVVHRLRDGYDAIMVGINTIIRDDPVDPRLADGQPGRDPIRIILIADWCFTQARVYLNPMLR